MSLIQNEWSIDDFYIGKPLGSGRFGRVYLAQETKSEHEVLVAIKIMFKSMLIKNSSELMLKSEVEIQSSLNHPNILSLYTWFHDDTKIYLVLEFALNGSLLRKLNNEKKFNNTIASTYIYQTTQALIYLHSLNIVHRDLKPENLLLSYNDEIKLADFGWAYRFDEEDDFKVAGTLDYLCPEMLSNSKYDKKIDNWCLGVLIYELLVGQPPFFSNTEVETKRKILNLDYNFPRCVIYLAKDLISKLLVTNPNNRLELGDVLNSSWIENYANMNEVSLY